MSYDTKKDTITVNDVTYDIEREDDRGHPEQTLTVTTFNVETDEYEDAFPGLSATLGYEEYDQHFHNPRDWAGNVGTMAVSYRGYELGDEDISKIDFEVIRGEDEDGYDNWVTLDPVTYFKEERGARVVLGLTVYEHSGLTMYVGSVGDYPFDQAGWDSSFVGFIYDTPENVKECMGDDVSDDDIEKALRSEVKVYASYLEGDIACFFVNDDESDYHDGCGGYVGDHERCEQDCFEALEHAIEARLAEMQERADAAARDIITKE